jgi:anti-sigma B factor antagonist
MSVQQIRPIGVADPQSLLSVRLAGDGCPTVIEVSGEIDLSTAHLLTELVEQVARDCPAQVILDMAEVRFFCAEGVRALLHARATVAAAGQLLLRAPSAQTWRVLTLTGTDHLFPLDATSEAICRDDGSLVSGAG